MTGGELREFAPFVLLRPEARQILAERGVARTYDPGQVLWRQGTLATGVYFVLEGEVKIIRTGDGREHIIHWGRPGSTLGDVPLFTDGGYPATAVAARRTRCLVADRATLEMAISADPALARLFLANLADRVRFLVDRLDERSRENVKSRLVRYLESRSRQANGAWFRLGLTQVELAEELGTVREVVVRALAELRKSGVLQADRGRYQLLDARRVDDFLQGHDSGSPGE